MAGKSTAGSAAVADFGSFGTPPFRPEQISPGPGGFVHARRYPAPNARIPPSEIGATRRPPGVSLVIPAYNEQDRLVQALEQYLPVLEASNLPYEVIVVADGSDRTAEIARRYEARAVQVLPAEVRLGKGGAILLGFRHSKYDVVGFTDSDGSLSSSDFSRMIGMMCNSTLDCVIGSRRLKGSRWIHKEPLSRRVASRGFNVLVRALLSLPVRDTQCGAKLFRGAIVDRLLRHVVVTNFTTDVGILFHVRRSGGTITEFPVTWDHDPRSHFRLGPMIPVMLSTVIGIRIMNLPIGKYVPQRLVRRFVREFGVF